MALSKITDEQLIELAKSELIEESDLQVWDIYYYQENHTIIDGKNKIFIDHLFFHYSNWSANPISKEDFLHTIKLKHKTNKVIYLNKNICKINFTKLIGDYVKKQKRKEKEERLRKIPSTKSKT